MTEAAASRAPEAAPGHVRSGDGLLGAADVRALAAQVGLRPTKTRGQNFVIDANTVRRIVRVAAIRPDDVVLEVGPGLGALTLGLLRRRSRRRRRGRPRARRGAAGRPSPARRPDLASGSRWSPRTRCGSTRSRDRSPTALVANLPYNVAVPVLLHLLDLLPELDRVLVMVQAEVADRLAAGPGSRTYGVPASRPLVRRRHAGRLGRAHRVLAGARRSTAVSSR